MCRKAHGAGYVTWVGYEQEQVEFTSGEENLAWYASSPLAQRGFCKVCGSTLFFRSERWSGELHIARAAFDDDIGIEPQANVFFGAHVDWMPIDASLKKVNG